jgi:phosphonopyruvate decarboxylase
MHLGSFAIVGQSKARNFIHVVLNNGVHDSVGGQPTVGFGVNLCAIAEACGYPSQTKVIDSTGVIDAVDFALSTPGPHFIEVLVRPGSRSDLGRPTRTPEQNKMDLMDFVKSSGSR